MHMISGQCSSRNIRDPWWGPSRGEQSTHLHNEAKNKNHRYDTQNEKIRTQSAVPLVSMSKGGPHGLPKQLFKYKRALLYYYGPAIWKLTLHDDHFEDCECCGRNHRPTAANNLKFSTQIWVCTWSDWQLMQLSEIVLREDVGKRTFCEGWKRKNPNLNRKELLREAIVVHTC